LGEPVVLARLLLQRADFRGMCEIRRRRREDRRRLLFCRTDGTSEETGPAMMSSIRFYWRRRAIRRAWSGGRLTFSEALWELDRLARAA
jgi:hypothetical protein